MIDLHVHTSASDGQYRPGELLRRAAQAGIDVLAVTDHDTVAGIAEAEREAAPLGVRLIPGIEFSTFAGHREAHILGHFIDPAEPGIRGFSRVLREARAQRMARMIERLNALGLGVALADVERISSGKNLGRPHLARAMIERGYVRDVKEAFDRYLAVGAPAYVERFKLSSSEAIGLIHRAGGTATLAHPRVSQLTGEEIASLQQLGLAGLEVNHSDQGEAARAELLAIARALDLVPTSGSDFHGEVVAPGRRLGDAQMRREDLARLEERRPAGGAREVSRERRG